MVSWEGTVIPRVGDGIARVGDGIARVSDGIARVSDGIARVGDGIAWVADEKPVLSRFLVFQIRGLYWNKCINTNYV
ncbi:hypothetical protein [Pontibacillus sp. HMF3514]|uniref:hypothetical protein n=1 Tax=Pontibacillus sp. HMF3514 TaxID=2692425 RepID=UPI00131FF4A6|nr:hypothetical protein [Pontibacillus sp. HMF3514]QHE52597.1 hypothetical protein GS400_11375 [Pontibacillus sp. HMF3514]